MMRALFLVCLLGLTGCSSVGSWLCSKALDIDCQELIDTYKQLRDTLNGEEKK